MNHDLSYHVDNFCHSVADNALRHACLREAALLSRWSTPAERERRVAMHEDAVVRMAGELESMRADLGWTQR